MSLVAMWFLIGITTSVLATRAVQALIYCALGPLALLWHVRRHGARRGQSTDPRASI